MNKYQIIIGILVVLLIVALFIAFKYWQFWATSNLSLSNQVQVWGDNVSIPANGYLFGSLDDAFDNQIKINASSPINILILSAKQYNEFILCGETLFCALKNYTNDYHGTQINEWFNLSSGCSGYVSVIFGNDTESVFVYPNESVLYNPSSIPTGICASHN